MTMAHRRLALTVAGLALSATAATVPATAGAVSIKGRPGATAAAAKPYFDSRTSARRATPRTSAAARSARGALRARLGRQAVIDVDALTGTARTIQRLDGALSGTSAGDRTTVALNWLRANRAAVGLDLATIDKLAAPRRVDGAKGLAVLHFRQADRGVPAFDNEVRVVLDRYNRVLAVGGSPLADPSVASVDPKLSASEALRALQRDVGVQQAIDVSSGPSGATRATRFGGVDRARLVLFGTASGARLAWHVQYQATSVALYDAVVDATSGAILLRQNLTKFASNAVVYPNYPGAESDSHPAKALAGQPEVVDLTARGYLPLVPAKLSGKNVKAFSDVNDDNVENLGPNEIVPPNSGTNFLYPLTPFGPDPPATGSCSSRGINATCTWAPYADPDSWKTNRKQNATQAFYLANIWHDWLERPTINFDEDSGNFEVGGPGGDDPLILEADDGAATGDDGGPDDDHVNNANMSTPIDGDSPRTQMYLFKFNDDPDAFYRFRNINGGDDSGTVYHEYTHGLSERLVTNADGSGALATPHAGAMGEAWSDWYALDYLHRADSETGRPELELDDPNVVGEVDIGVYTDADFLATRFSPYDCPPGVIAPNCPGGISTGPGGYTLGDFGKVAFGPEVHSDGEIWVQTLWDLRERLVQAFADEELGADIAEILVTDAMRISPPEPSFLDMRNAILAVAQNELNGVGVDAVWSVFAGRGMGFFASVVDGSDVAPIEDFNVPPDPDAPTGTITGRVTSADSGLPLAGVTIGVAGLSTELKEGTSPASLAATSAADGTYTLEAPAHVYPKIFFKGTAGFDLVSVSDVQVTAGSQTVRNAALRRDWAARSGGGEVTGNDDSGGPYGCGLDQLIDQSLGAGWSPYNPETEDPEYDGDGSPPTAVIKLPQTIDVSSFGLDPSNTCGDDPSATTKDYKLETSSDGTTFTLARAGSFTLADRNRLNIVAPTGGRHERALRAPDAALATERRSGRLGRGLHRLLGDRDLRRPGQRAARRHAVGDAGGDHGGPDRELQRVELHRRRLADHRLRLGLRRQRHGRPLDGHADDLLRLRRRRHVRRKGPGEGLPRRRGHGDRDSQRAPGQRPARTAAATSAAARQAGDLLPHQPAARSPRRARDVRRALRADRHAEDQRRRPAQARPAAPHPAHGQADDHIQAPPDDHAEALAERHQRDEAPRPEAAVDQRELHREVRRPALDESVQEHPRPPLITRRGARRVKCDAPVMFRVGWASWHGRPAHTTSTGSSSAPASAAASPRCA